MSSDIQLEFDDLRRSIKQYHDEQMLIIAEMHEEQMKIINQIRNQFADKKFEQYLEEAKNGHTSN